MSVVATVAAPAAPSPPAAADAVTPGSDRKAATLNAAALLLGTVRHTRLRPVPHAFAYPTFCVLLPLRSWAEGRAAPVLARNRFAWMSFHDADHGAGGPDALAWVQGLLAERGVRDADGEIWLLTYPRVLGFVFKPVSFWYCHRADARLRAIIAEVNNTFGERHLYLLDGADVAWGRTLQADKALHVSPFIPVRGHYRFRFARTGAQGTRAGAAPQAWCHLTEAQAAAAPASHAPPAAPRRPERLVARVEHGDSAGPLLITSLSGTLVPLTPASARRALLSMPLLTFGVVARIHWQALRLWLKRVPWWRKPPPPPHPVTLGGRRAAAISTELVHPEERTA